MRPYFEKMKEFGRPLSAGLLKSTEENARQIKQVESELEEAMEKVKQVGFSE